VNTHLDLKSRFVKLTGRRKALVLGISLLLFVLIFVQFFLSFFVQQIVNHKLNRIGDYHGHADRVFVNLWRGAYSIHGLDLQKVTGEVPVPFFKAKRIDFNVQWKALIHGSIVGDVEFFTPEINLVRDVEPGKDKVETPKAESKDVVQELSPLKIDRIQIHEGSLHFKDFTKQPKVDVYLSRINGEAKNLTNSRELSKTLMGTIDMHGQVMDNGRFDFYLVLNPFSKVPTFETRTRAIFSLPEVNNFLEHYLAVEAEGGTLDIYIEGAAAEGKFKGYIKPFLQHDNAFKITDKNKSALDTVKGAVVKSATMLFKNPEKQDNATKVDFEGSFKSPDIKQFEALLNFFRNALLAIPPGFEDEDKGTPHVTPGGKLSDNESTPEASKASPNQTN
jgi:hypothetical protein